MRRGITLLIAAGILAVGVAALVDALRGSRAQSRPAIRNPYLFPSTVPGADDRLPTCTAACSDGGNPPLTTTLPTASRPLLVKASPHLRAKCQTTANEVGYPVPCPTLVPDGLIPTRGYGGCQLAIVGPGGVRGCGKAWRGWVIGSNETSDQHLVIAASPRPLRSAAKVVNGPGWYPGAQVRRLRSLTINGWRVRAVYVPPATNDGSAFASHVVLIWTVG